MRGENLRINRRKKKIEDSGKMEIERLTDGEEEEGISFLKERPLDDAAKKKQIWLWLRKRRRRSISQESVFSLFFC